MELSKTFISAAGQYGTFEQPVPAPYLRRRVTVEKPVRDAIISICGLGFYELFLNGRRITKGRLAPYISNPDDVLYYDVYDVGSLLQAGENIIGVLLGNGMQNPMGGEVWEFNQAAWRSAPKLAMTLELVFEDGDTERIYGDESFRTWPSPIFMDDLRAGEFYDARNETEGWNRIGFDDSAWPSAILTEVPKGEALICRVEPIIVSRELKPVSVRRGRIAAFPETRQNLPVIELPDDEKINEGWLYDFGVNTAGVCRLKVRGKRGQKIILQFGELLTEDGGLDLRAMMFLPRRYNHRDIYICRGGEEEIHSPVFTYHGFRYCLVMGITEEQADTDLLTYEEMHSDVKVRGGFSCSDRTANALWDAAIVSDLANFYYFPTDCPHREKNGWTGDAAVSAEQMVFCLSVENSWREWLRNIRKTQTERGALPGIIPTSGWGFEWGNGPAWDAALFCLPFYAWIYRGDRTILEENAASMLRYLSYLSERCDENGLLHFGLGDWCHAGRPSDCPKAPLVVTDTLIGMDICEKAGRCFAVLGQVLQKQFAESMYGRLRRAARKHLIERNSLTVQGECQSSQAMGLYYGLFEEEEKPEAFRILMELVQQSGGCLDVGILGARVLFHVLAEYGEEELAFQMIVQRKFPSYGCWIDEGATSLFESFQRPGDYPESKNHHFFGDIISWLIKYPAGIVVNPDGADCGCVDIAPRFLSVLSCAEGFYDSTEGRVESSWKRLKDGTVCLKISAPEGIRGCLRMPEGYCFADGEIEKRLVPGIYEIIPVKFQEC